MIPISHMVRMAPMHLLLPLQVLVLTTVMTTAARTTIITMIVPVNTLDAKLLYRAEKATSTGKIDTPYVNKTTSIAHVPGEKPNDVSRNAVINYDEILTLRLPRNKGTISDCRVTATKIKINRVSPRVINLQDLVATLHCHLPLPMQSKEESIIQVI